MAPGGIIANIGVHGVKVDLHLEKLWDRNIIDHHPPRRHGHDADAAEDRAVEEDRPEAAHHPPLQVRQILDAYDTFGHAAETHALKVVIAA